MLLLVNSAYEKRAFIYFDIISWLESKIEKRPVQDIIQQKANEKFGRRLNK
jgi:RNase P/RNase MRP subunit POP5